MTHRKTTLETAMITPTGGTERRALGDILGSISFGGDATALWTGQSNSFQGRDSLGVNDPVDTRAEIMDWTSLDFVPLAKGSGGIDPDSGQHSLFNFSTGLLALGHSNVKIVTSFLSGRPWNEWVGTPADRTVSVGNRPRMVEIVERSDALAIPYKYVCIQHGEADYANAIYVSERIFFMRDLIERGYADENTTWLHFEAVDHPDTRYLTWVVNHAINAIPVFSSDIRKQIIVPSTGLLGLDEGLEANGRGYRIHYSSAECSELGTIAAACIAAARQNVTPRYPSSEIVNPLGRQGSQLPRLNIDGTETPTVTLDIGYCNGTHVYLTAGSCTLTIGDDALFGNTLAAGAHFTAVAQSGTVLTIATIEYEFQDIFYDTQVRSTMILRASATRTIHAHFVFDGARWVLDQAVDRRVGSSGGIRWAVLDGQIFVEGTVTISSASGSTAAVTFPIDMPALAGTSFTIMSDMCTASAITTSGFTLTRNVAVTGGAGVQWGFHAKLAML